MKTTDDPSELTMTQLANHIEETHHIYLRSELPRLRELIAAVVEKHGEAFPWLQRVRSIFAELEGELEPHMAKEEQILFPMIREMERTEGSGPHQIMVESPISVMEHEHDNAKRALRHLRDVTSGFTVPGEASASFRTMVEGLEALERDLHEHIHKENDILFVRARAAQEQP